MTTPVSILNLFQLNTTISTLSLNEESEVVSSNDDSYRDLLPDDLNNSNLLSTKTDNIIAALIIFIVGSLGLTANITACVIIRRIASLKTCFGYLLLLHASAEASIMIIFIFWAAPISVFNHGLSKSLLGIKLGHLILFFYYICLYSQLAKAINRLVAISNPVIYRQYFNDSQTKFIILTILIIAILHSIVYFFDGCNFYFNGETYIWSFDVTECGTALGFYIDFIYGCSLMTCIIFTDFCTFLFIQKGRKITSTNTSQKSSKEIKFFIQACLTSVLYALMLASFHLVYRFYDDPWILFASTTLAWELCHAIDGILMILFNSKLRSKTPTVSIIQSSKASFRRNDISRIT